MDFLFQLWGDISQKEVESWISYFTLFFAGVAAWFAFKQYRLKSSLHIRSLATFENVGFYKDRYISNVSLQNLKDKSEAIFGVYARFGNSIYVTLEDMSKEPLILNPFETVVRKYEPVSNYHSNLNRVNINSHFGGDSVFEIIVSTASGKYITKQVKDSWSPIFEKSKNRYISLVSPSRKIGINSLTGKKEVVPTYAKYVVSFEGQDSKFETYIFDDPMLKVNDEIFEITSAVLNSKESLSTHLECIPDLKRKMGLSFKTIIIQEVEEIVEDSVLDLLLSDTEYQLKSSSWIKTNIWGKIDNKIRKRRLKEKSFNIRSKLFTYNEKILIRVILAAVLLIIGYAMIKFYYLF